MIVKNTLDGWQIITQTGHAFVAVQIAEKLSKTFITDFWLETLLGIYNHETLATDFNSGRILNDKGMPLDFRESESSRKMVNDKVQRMISTTAYRSSIVSALIARHSKFLHSKELYKRVESDCDKIIDETCNLYKISNDEFESMYGVLKFADRLSLMICCDELPNIDRKIEINDGLKNTSTFVCCKDGNLSITNWPFEQNSITIPTEFKLLKLAKFDTEENFLNEYHSEVKQLKLINFSKSN